MPIMGFHRPLVVLVVVIVWSLGPDDRTTSPTLEHERFSAAIIQMAPPSTLLLLGLLCGLLVLPLAHSIVLQRVHGMADSEIGHASAGTHIYLTGTDIGSAFAPPSIFLGVRTQAECQIQPFTSTCLPAAQSVAAIVSGSCARAARARSVACVS